MADLHLAWTAEQRCVDRLALATSRRDLFRSVAVLEAGRADRLTALEVTSQQAATAVARAQQRADASAAAIAVQAARLRDRLLTAWEAQRAAAGEAAQVVLDGPGRLGFRRAAVARAAEQLTAWADTWQPYLPAMPTDPRGIASLAGSADDRARLRAAFDDHARRHAESARPEHSRLTAEADAAQTAHGRARRDLAQARREREDRRARLDATGHPFDPDVHVADAERDVAATEQQLAVARTRVAQLRAEPALLSQPADLLTRERERWLARHDAEDNPARTGNPHVRSGFGTPPPDLKPISLLAPHPDTGPGVGR